MRRPIILLFCASLLGLAVPPAVAAAEGSWVPLSAVTSQKISPKLIKIPQKVKERIDSGEAPPLPTATLPTVSIAVKTCDYFKAEPDASLDRHPDYSEVRYCRIPLPDGAHIRRFRSYAYHADSFGRATILTITPLSFVAPDSDSSFQIIKLGSQENRLKRDGYECRGEGGVPFFQVRMKLEEVTKNFECSGDITKSADSDLYIELTTRAYWRSEVRDTAIDMINSSPHLLFPFVELIQVEYEME